MSARVRFLDHTADAALEGEATSLDDLFRAVAEGMLRLLAGREEEVGAVEPVPAGAVVEELDLVAPDLPRLLAGWLRELLFLHDARAQDYAGAEFEWLEPTHLVARVWLRPASPAVREIKGVTYHGLTAERLGGGWRARVIFDV